MKITPTYNDKWNRSGTLLLEIEKKFGKALRAGNRTYIIGSVSAYNGF